VHGCLWLGFDEEIGLGWFSKRAVRIERKQIPSEMDRAVPRISLALNPGYDSPNDRKQEQS
jgi:hypothetical protein